MAMFTGFKPSGMQKIANRLGYSGDMVNFDNYLQQNPDKQRQMIVFEEAARKMAEGGYVRMQTGGTPSLNVPISIPGGEVDPNRNLDELPTQPIPQQNIPATSDITDVAAQ